MKSIIFSLYASKKKIERNPLKDPFLILPIKKISELLLQILCKYLQLCSLAYRDIMFSIFK